MGVADDTLVSTASALGGVVVACAHESPLECRRRVAGSREELVQAAQVLKSWFGPNGWQAVAYNAELGAQFRLCKAISQDEERRWQQYGRLPDRVNVAHPTQSPTVDWQEARTTRLLQGLAGMGACALGMEALARQAVR